MTVQLASDPERLAGLARLEIRALTAVEGLTGGHHRSSLHGASTHFAQHRAYVPGDDLRHLDWKLMARSNKDIVRQYEEETDLTVAILVDASASMEYASLTWTKWEYATWIAATLAQLLWMQNDRCGLGIAGQSGLQEWLPPSRGSSQKKSIFKILENTKPSGKDAPTQAVETCLENLRQKSLIIWIGDCLSDTKNILETSTKILHKGHDLIVLRTLDPAEIEFPFSQNTRFIGLESNQNLMADPRAIRKAYLEQFNHHAKRLRRGLRKIQADFERFATDKPFEIAMRKLLYRRNNQQKRSRR